MCRRCSDCEAAVGELHELFCLKERCPFCGHQLATCGCISTVLELDADDARPSKSTRMTRPNRSGALSARWKAAMQTERAHPVWRMRAPDRAIKGSQDSLRTTSETSCRSASGPRGDGWSSSRQMLPGRRAWRIRRPTLVYGPGEMNLDSRKGTGVVEPAPVPQCSPDSGGDRVARNSATCCVSAQRGEGQSRRSRPLPEPATSTTTAPARGSGRRPSVAISPLARHAIKGGATQDKASERRT